MIIEVAFELIKPVEENIVRIKENTKVTIKSKIMDTLIFDKYFFIVHTSLGLYA